MRKISQLEFERIVNRFLSQTDEETTKVLQDPATTNFDALVGGIIQRAVHTRDEKKAEWILARTLGKMREKLDISSNSQRVNVNLSAQLPSAEQISLENPNLSLAQLEAYSEKLAKMRLELQASDAFAEAVVQPAPGIIDVEAREGGESEPAASAARGSGKGEDFSP